MSKKYKRPLITYNYDEIGPNTFSFTGLIREFLGIDKQKPSAHSYTKRISQLVQESHLGDDGLTVDLLAHPLFEVLFQLRNFRKLCHSEAGEDVLLGVLGSIVSDIAKAASLSYPVCNLIKDVPRNTPRRIKRLVSECASLQNEFDFLVAQVQWIKKNDRMIQVLSQPISDIEEEILSKANNSLNAIRRRVYSVLQSLALVKLSFASDLSLAQLLKSKETSVAA